VDYGDPGIRTDPGGRTSPSWRCWRPWGSPSATRTCAELLAAARADTRPWSPSSSIDPVTEPRTAHPSHGRRPPTGATDRTTSRTAPPSLQPLGPLLAEPSALSGSTAWADPLPIRTHRLPRPHHRLTTAGGRGPGMVASASWSRLRDAVPTRSPVGRLAALRRADGVPTGCGHYRELGRARRLGRRAGWGVRGTLPLNAAFLDGPVVDPSPYRLPVDSP